MESFILLAASDGSTPKDALRLMTVTIAIGAALFGLFAFVLLIALMRRRRRLKMLKQASERRRAIEDAWKASGDRVETPSAESLDNDRLDMEDTKLPGDSPEFPGDEDEPPPEKRGRR